MKDTITIVMIDQKLGIYEDLEVPKYISANDLILALQKMYSVEKKMDSPAEYYLKSNYPKALLKGEKTLEEYGLHDGSEIYLWNRD